MQADATGRHRLLLAVIVIAAGAVGCKTTTSSDQQAIGDDAGVQDAAVQDAFSHVDAPPEPTTTVVKRFTCNTAGMPPDYEIAEVAGTAGDKLIIKSTAQPCQFDLVYRPASGSDVTLSDAPSGYLIAAAADRVVCASPIDHGPEVVGEPTHIIDQVPLECALKSASGTWLSMQTIADSGGTWAAWVSEVTREDADTYTVRYIRDFSFQFANLGELGRPPEDGYYDQTLEIVGDSLVVSGNPVLVTSDFASASIDNPTPGCPAGEFDPNDPACQDPPEEPVTAPRQHPGAGQYDGVPSGTDIASGLNAGYRWTADVDGTVVSLGGYFNGTKTVRLYDYATGNVLASVAHTSSNSFSYTDITPVSVTAGSTYVVAVEMDGSGAAYDNPVAYPVDYGDYTIDCAGTSHSSPSMPTNCTDAYWGMADLQFVPADSP